MLRAYRVFILEDDLNRIVHFKERFREMEYNYVNITHVETAEEAIKKLSSEKYDVLFLDHDLGGEAYVSTDHKNTGSEVVRWFENNPNNLNDDVLKVIHSFNPSGAQYMNKGLKNSVMIPGVWAQDRFEAYMEKFGYTTLPKD